MDRLFQESARFKPRLYPTASSALARRLASRTEEPLLSYPPLEESLEVEEEPEGPREWDWERWAERTEGVEVRLVRNLERMTWGGIGALLGTAVAALPAFFIGFQTYPFVFAQPLGAALGAIAGTVAVARTWRLSPGARDAQRGGADR